MSARISTHSFSIPGQRCREGDCCVTPHYGPCRSTDTRWSSAFSDLSRCVPLIDAGFHVVRSTHGARRRLRESSYLPNFAKPRAIVEPTGLLQIRQISNRSPGSQERLSYATPRLFEFPFFLSEHCESGGGVVEGRVRRPVDMKASLADAWPMCAPRP